jgi:hypothetical protein
MAKSLYARRHLFCHAPEHHRWRADTAAGLAQQAVSSGIAPIDAINLGYVPGTQAVGEQFARGQVYLPEIWPPPRRCGQRWPSSTPN